MGTYEVTGTAPLPITRAKAEQLYWLGRYSERVYTTLGRLGKTYDANVDLETADFSEFYRALDLSFDTGLGLEELVASILYNADDPNSVCASMRAAFGNAIELRPELGTETVSYVELALIHLRASKDALSRLPRHRDVRDNLLAFWGSIEDGMGSMEAKAMIFFGKYVERLELWSRFGEPAATLDRPLRKLIFYLGYVRHPECLGIEGALSALLANLTARGYGEELTGRLGDVLEIVRRRGGSAA